MNRSCREIKVIKKAICKWNLIAYGLMQSKGSKNCPLCILFYDNDCHLCPIYSTNPDNYKCKNTPCMKTKSYTYLYDFPEMAVFVEQEIILLCSLLPEDHKLHESYKKLDT